MNDASKEGLKANQRVVPESAIKKLKGRIKEFERARGRRTMQVEINPNTSDQLSVRSCGPR